MHVGADHVADHGAFGVVLAVVAGAFGIHHAQRLHALAQEGLPGMVLVADDIAELLGMLDQIADHAHVAALGVHAEDADAVKPSAVNRLEVFSE